MFLCLCRPLSFSPSVRYKYISRARRHSGRARYENQRRYRSASGYVISAAILSTGNYSRDACICLLARSQPSPVVLPGERREKCGIIARDRARKLSGACVCSCIHRRGEYSFSFFSFSLLSLSLGLFFRFSLYLSPFLSFSFFLLSLSILRRPLNVSLGNTAARALCDLTYDPASRTVTFERHR